MFKRLIVYLILASMILHCAARLSLLDSLYQKRHRIAYDLGLIAEIPIAICSGDYDFDGKLSFKSYDKDEASTPINYQPTEITLFFLAEDTNVNSHLESANCSALTHYAAILYKSPDRTIFQPPRL